MITIRKLAAAAFTAGLLFASAACATAPAPTPTANADAAEAADTDLLDKALASFQSTGYRGLAQHVPALRAALDRTPKEYPVIERRTDVTIVRSEDFTEGFMLLLMASGLGNKDGETTHVVQKRNVYPMIALLLSSEAVERGDHHAALAFADRGLAMQPDHEVLLLEKGAALQGLERWEDALALADKALAEGGGLLPDFNAAPFHRRRGFSLIELNRLEEAKAAYEKSLELEPDNKAAQNELVYIRQLIAGGQRTGSVFVNPNAPQR